MDQRGARVGRGREERVGIEVRRHRDDRVGHARVEGASSPGPVTATVPIPSRRHVEKMRTAISPRFATSSFRAALTAATLED